MEELELVEEGGEALLEAVGQHTATMLFSRQLFNQHTLPRSPTGKEIPSGTLSLASLSEFKRMKFLNLQEITLSPEVITEDENGVAVIKEEAFSRGKAAKEEFRNLVNDVIKTHEGKDQAEGASKTAGTGIDDLFGDLGLDIHQIVSSHDKIGAEEKPETSSAAAARREDLFENGFLNIQAIFSRYRKDETGITKSLVDISRKFSSYFCGLLIVNEGRLEGRYSVGLSEKKFKNSEIEFGPYFGNAIRGSGKAVVVDWPIQKIKEIEGLIPGLDVSTKFYPIFIPITFEDDKGFLFLSIREILSSEHIRDILRKIAESRR